MYIFRLTRISRNPTVTDAIPTPGEPIAIEEHIGRIQQTPDEIHQYKLSYTNEMNACEDVGLFLANTAGPYADEDEYDEQNRDSVHVYETPGSVPVNESPDSVPVYESPDSVPVYETPGSVHVYESPDHIVQYGRC